MTLHRSPFMQSLPTFKALKGVRFGTAESQSRYKGRDDLLLVLFDSNASVGGVLTQNQCPGIPVLWCRDRLLDSASSARALVVNAGNANVFTGAQGCEAAQCCAEKTAELFKISPYQVFLGSTGVIGEPFPTNAILAAIETASENLSAEHWEKASRAIMTTDTFPKGAVRTAVIGGATVTLQGFAKGSGMIAPNMATMLAYIFTDATLPSACLQEMMAKASAQSFNAITVDSDTSTSDMALCFATNVQKNPIPETADDPLLSDFYAKLCELTKELALLVLKDGEGVSRLMRVTVKKAASFEAAKKTAFAVAQSPLVKTALAGGDPNWGRVAMAIGKSGVPVNPEKLKISFCGIDVAANGGCLAYDEPLLAQKIQQPEVDIDIDMNLGEESAEVWGCDFTKAYIDINASYRS